MTRPSWRSLTEKVKSVPRKRDFRPAAPSSSSADYPEHETLRFGRLKRTIAGALSGFALVAFVAGCDDLGGSPPVMDSGVPFDAWRHDTRSDSRPAPDLDVSADGRAAVSDGGDAAAVDQTSGER